MTIAQNDRLPSATLLHQKGETVTEVKLRDRTLGRRVVIFGLPGAYTGTCSATHLPSFIRTAEAFRAKGIDEIICVAVNDVRVMYHWGCTSGAEGAGITMLADWDAAFTRALGLNFDDPAIGFKDRLTRCAMLVEDGIVKVLHLEEKSGVCNLTAGESMLEAI